MKLTVSAVSKSGLGLKALDNNWYNRAGKANFTDFSGLKKGDTIEADVADGKWVNAYSLLGGSTEPQEEAKEALQHSEHTSNGGNGRSSNDPERQLLIIRQSSAATAFKFYAEQKSMDHSEAVSLAKTLSDQLVNFVLTGKFGSKA